MQIKLSPRLQSVLELVPICNVAADIGCDHGKLAMCLIESGKVKRVIAADISRPSLEKAKELFAQSDYAGLAEFRAGDGLQVLKPHEAQSIIIAGMGGRLTAQILEKGHSDCSYILQPMQHVSELRKSLREMGYSICSEKTSQEDDRIYEAILAIRDEGKARENYIEALPHELEDIVGPILFIERDELALRKLIHKKGVLRSKLDLLNSFSTPSACTSRDEAERTLSSIEEILEKWKEEKI